MTHHQPLPEITLRAIEPEDLDLLYKIENDRRLWNVGTTNVPYSRYALQSYVANNRYNIYEDEQVRMMVENSEGEVVAIADLMNFDAQNRKAEIGLVVINSFRRRGYATATVLYLKDYALRTLHLHQLYIFVDAGNTASVSLFQKLGFSCSNILKDWLYDGRDYHDALLMQILL